MGLGRRR